MDRLIDSVVLWIVCVAFVFQAHQGEFSIVGVLTAAVAVCACQVIWRPLARACVIGAFTALCAIMPEAFCFLPVAACLGTFEHARTVRLMWVAGWAVGCARWGMANAAVVLMLCAAGVILAAKTAYHARGLRGITVSRDGMREEMIALAARASAMEAELAGKTRTEDGRAAGEADAVAEDPLMGLTERERDIAALVAQGLDNRQIAERLFLSEGTIRNNISAILGKKQLKNRTQLAVLCLAPARAPQAES